MNSTASGGPVWRRPAVTEMMQRTADGMIIYDADLVSAVSEATFAAGSWPEATAVTGTFKAGGRGQAMIVKSGHNEFVLRHYLRGGLVGKLVRDRYVWTGEDQTRSFQEWRLLAKMFRMGLRVPRPAAASYSRHGRFYSADLLTLRIPGIQSLSDRIVAGGTDQMFWEDLGKDIHSFHEASVYHADLNAENIQLDRANNLWLLDFDRGKLLPPGPWQQRNLARLHRSLRKIKKQKPDLRYSEICWRQLMDGYFSASRSS